MGRDYRSAILLFTPQDGVTLIARAEATGFTPVDDSTAHGLVCSIGAIDEKCDTSYAETLLNLYNTRVNPFLIKNYGEANLLYLDPLVIREDSTAEPTAFGRKWQTDHSLITISVKLNHSYEGGGIVFEGTSEVVSQGTGWGLTYLGSQLHTSHYVESGVRYTLRWSFYREATK